MKPIPEHGDVIIVCAVCIQVFLILDSKTNCSHSLEKYEWKKKIAMLRYPIKSRVARKPVFEVSDQVRHKLAVQPQKMARGLKLWISEVDRLYCLCSENKGANQLRCYRAADPRLCFRKCKKSGFLMTRFISKDCSNRGIGFRITKSTAQS